MVYILNISDESMIMISATSRLKLPALKSSLIFDRYKYRFVLCQLTTYSKTSTRCCSAAVPGSEVSPERPQIPHKIKRGPTELLEALASTVGTDPTGKFFFRTNVQPPSPPINSEK